MPGPRSPEYPSIGLPTAIAKISAIHAEEGLGRVPREVLAKHLGYNGLSGASLPILSALVRYGLLEGRADKTGVSVLAARIIAGRAEDDTYLAAIDEAAAKPPVFAALDREFPAGQPSGAALREFLVSRGFTKDGVERAIRAYRETKDFVRSISGSSDEPSASNEPSANASAGAVGSAGSHHNLPRAERVFAAGILGGDAAFRLLVTGKIGSREIDNLIAKLTLDRNIFADIETLGTLKD